MFKMRKSTISTKILAHVRARQKAGKFSGTEEKQLEEHYANQFRLIKAPS